MVPEEKQIIRRLMDLDNLADTKYMVTYSDFLSVTEYSIFLQNKKEFRCETLTFSAIDNLERQMVAFIPDALTFNNNYPITLLKIKYKNTKFAQKLSHKDILGTIMGLSIERRLVGDIFMSGDEFYVLVKNSISDLVIDEIHRIKRTEVVLEKCEIQDISIERKVETHYGTIASNRLDCIVAECGHLSRGRSSDLIKEGLIFINGAQAFRNMQEIKEGDLLSIRRIGKFRVTSIGEVSKKGKIKLTYEKFC
ncbi:MAG: hypothetical protein K6A30_06495 [Lachnospiraceae bacterium]|nr:hypothetical protein [Lachnospiraceae bacterium]